MSTDSSEVRAAIERSLPLLQSSMDTWIREVSCISCHHQGLGTMAVVMAEERGLPVDRELHERQVARVLERTPGGALHGDAGINGTFGRSFQLVALAAAGTPRDARTDAVASFLEGNATRPGPAGERPTWLSVSYRPPLEASPVTGTAFALRAIDLYHPEAHGEATRATVERARHWLEQLEPADAEQRAMRLIGLRWAAASSASLRRAAADILDAQRADGGWAQLDTLESDAYATGQALVALQQFGGIDPASPAFQRGLRFLLDRQLDDGSWLVETRRRSPGLPYFETGFPHGLHQFISTAATAWSTMALCCELDPAPSRALLGERPARRTDQVSIGLDELQLAAAFGTRDELERLLVAGHDPNRPGVDELTPLHLAVHDADKIELLLEHGAELEARTIRGATALVLAAWYDCDDDRAARLLLEAGANPHARAAKDGMTPLLRAVRSGKTELVEWLLAAGADLGAVDTGQLSALHWAVSGHDLAMAEVLLAAGSPVDPLCDGDTPLLWAAYDGDAELVRLLIGYGADPNVKGADGMTPIAWAAKVDHGNVRTLELLLSSGGDAAIPSDNGRTPLDWARSFSNELAVARLEQR